MTVTKSESLDEKDESSANEEVLKLARERFQIAESAESDIREAARDDLKFAAGEQWPEAVKASRHQDNRPCLTINRLPQFIRQVTNDQRQNRPAIKVSPVDDQADIDTAKIYQGLIRHIEYSSDADTAYDTAFQSAVTGGFGYFRIITDYCDPYSFEQDIKIQAIKNPFSVYLDPSHQCPAGSDANWGFIFTDMSQEEFKNLYPDSELKSMDWSHAQSLAQDWVQDSQVRIAEYFYKEFEEKTFVLLSDKSVVEKSMLPSVLPEGITIINERKAQVAKVCWVKTNGIEELERTEWPGQWIPIVKVIGEELIVDGKRILVSLVRHSKDAQRMLNYWKSSETEAIALAPKAPFVVAEGQLEGYEALWKSSNTKNHPYLPYKPMAHSGQPVPAPQRQNFEPAVQAITQAAMMAQDDLKGTMGIFDAQLGARSNESSGIAIQRRNIQAQTSNFHFIDNLAKSIRHAGRILVDLIPHIYDTERAVRILGEDGSEEVVKINAEFDEQGNQTPQLNKGKYDVTVSTGPSYETKRQESLATMLELSKSVPLLTQGAPDLLIKAMDFPMAQELAERVKKMLPPGLADDKDKQNKIPPEAQAQIQQMNQVIEQLTQELHAHAEDKEGKRMELESRERIEAMKLNAQIEMKLAEMGSKEAQALLAHEVASIKHRLELLNINEPISENDPSMSGQRLGFDESLTNQPLTGEPQSPASVGAP